MKRIRPHENTLECRRSQAPAMAGVRAAPEAAIVVTCCALAGC